jgi:hypothetical protein
MEITDQVNKAMELMKQVRQNLEFSRDYIRMKIIKSNDGLWGTDRFLNGKVVAVHKGIYGTASAISALCFCGEAHNSDYINNSVKLLLSDEFRIQGGWATRSIKRDCQKPTVNATCYVLNALLDAGTDIHDPAIVNGIRFLINARNAAHRWGDYPGDESDKLTATCNAVMTIMKATEPGCIIPLQDLTEAQDWLRRQQDPASGGWPKDEPDAPYTALVIMALSALRTDSAIIEKGIQFLKCNVDNWKIHTERFRIAQVDGSYKDEEYNIFTEALAISALISAHTNPCSDEILNGVERLIRMQGADKKYWRDSSGNVPSWEMMYGCRAYRDFVGAMSSRLLIFANASEIGRILTELADIRLVVSQKASALEHKQTNDAITALRGDVTQQLNDIETRISKDIETRISKLESHRLSYQIARIIKSKYNLFFFAIVWFIVWSLLYLSWLGPMVLQNNNTLVAWLAGVSLSPILAFISIFQGALNRRPNQQNP